MRWPRRRPSSEGLLWDSPVVVRVPPVVLPEVGAELTESDLVSDGTTTNRDSDQTEAALEPNLLQFSYEEQYRSFLDGLWRDSDPDGVCSIEEGHCEAESPNLRGADADGQRCESKLRSRDVLGVSGRQMKTDLLWKDHHWCSSYPQDLSYTFPGT
ncbi:unnamed protein product [Dicrocoelium dendriticum]|nr:unnamed protein product [Dicrocoelium dendriticum]